MFYREGYVTRVSFSWVGGLLRRLQRALRGQWRSFVKNKLPPQRLWILPFLTLPLLPLLCIEWVMWFLHTILELKLRDPEVNLKRYFEYILCFKVEPLYIIYIMAFELHQCAPQHRGQQGLFLTYSGEKMVITVFCVFPSAIKLLYIVYTVCWFNSKMELL